jgi:hypothetical protein
VLLVVVGEGEGEGDGDELEELGVGLGDVDETDGDDEGLAGGVLDGELDGLAAAELPWAGPTRFGVCTCW